MLLTTASTQFEIVRDKFFANDPKFKDFAEIDKDEIKRIKDLVKEEDQNFASAIAISEIKNYKLARYVVVLKFLASHKTNIQLPTYDAKIVFLIEAMDPEMAMYDIYQENQKSNVFPNHINEKAKDRKGIDKITNKIRNELGFYDRKFLEYEVRYITRFILKFNKYVDPSIWHKFQLSCLSLKNFDELDSYQNDDIILKSTDYLDKYNKPPYKNLCYQLLCQPQLLGVKTAYEKALFFILVMDKDLRMLYIYEEASTWNEIEDNIRDEFGFFSKRMVLLEKEYQRRFYPDLDTSWIREKEI